MKQSGFFHSFWAIYRKDLRIEWRTRDSLSAMLVFAAATQGYFIVRNRIWETLALLLVAFTLFRPGFWMDMVAPPFETLAPAEIEAAAMGAQVGQNLRLQVSGLNAVGDPVTVRIEDANVQARDVVGSLLAHQQAEAPTEPGRRRRRKCLENKCFSDILCARQRPPHPSP